MQITEKKLEFINFTAFLPLQFWHELSKKKLEEYKLDDSLRPLWGTYKINNYKDNKSILNFDISSFDEKITQINNTGPVTMLVKGTLKNFNTIESFTKFNRESLFVDKGKLLFDEIEELLHHPNSIIDLYSWLNTFILFTFADLKTHLFRYCFASPSFQLREVHITRKEHLNQYLTNEKIQYFDQSLRDMIGVHLNKPFPQIFFLYKNEDKLEVYTSFKRYFDLFKGNDASKNYICLIDSYNQEDKLSPVLNNLLGLFLAFKNKNEKEEIILEALKNIKMIVLKDFMVAMPNPKINFVKSQYLEFDLTNTQFLTKSPEDKYPLLLGNEMLENIKIIDLKSQLDEKSLAATAVDLNIKLMKWRLLPELDIKKVQDLKCLLFGAGTLGCQVARNLMGWGVRNITFIDYGKVSHSNPVRQTLYDFEDATSGGKPKAETAAEKLKKIFPDMNSKGYNMEIPMPGHYANTPEKREQILHTLDTLEELVNSHDALFLMTDNRESRWLPTVLANKYNKICITVALGFDSYVVVRHGSPSNLHNFEKQGERLGCYFCNDILSPGNSMKDRTLDQMCTVTRPGLSFISSAYASELLISLIHHPLLNGAPAFEEEKKNNEETLLGILPQHIRGNLSDFETKIFFSRAFSNCVACSDYVLQDYCNNRDEFIIKVINDPDYLQHVTKISKMLEEAEKDECFSLNSFDSMDDKENQESDNNKIKIKENENEEAIL